MTADGRNDLVTGDRPVATTHDASLLRVAARRDFVQRASAFLARLEDAEADSGSLPLSVVRRSALFYALATVPLQLLVLFVVIGSVATRDLGDRVQASWQLAVPFALVATLAWPIFLGLRKRKRGALITLLCSLACAAAATGWYHEWRGLGVLTLFFLLSASCWQEVDR